MVVRAGWIRVAAALTLVGCAPVVSSAQDASGSISVSGSGGFAARGQENAMTAIDQLSCNVALYWQDHPASGFANVYLDNPEGKRMRQQQFYSDQYIQDSFTVTLGPYAREGLYTCWGSMSVIWAVGGSWGGSGSDSLYNTNPTCSCAASITPGAGVTRALRFNFSDAGGVIPENVKQMFREAADYWNGRLPGWAHITEGGGDITIIRNASLPPDTPAQNNHNLDGTGTIFWNPAFDGLLLSQLFHLHAHEWGHTLGLKDQSQCGQTATVMYKPVNLNGTMIGSPVAADICAAETDYR